MRLLVQDRILTDTGAGSVTGPASLADVLERAPKDAPSGPRPVVDPIEQLRAQEYGLLAALLGRAPTAATLDVVARLQGDSTPLGQAHAGLAQAAAQARPDDLQREFFDLFVGIGRGELLPYASYYLTGFLNERPLARVREDLDRIGIERVDGQSEPEDHIAILFDVMSGLASGAFGIDPAAEQRFFEQHLKPWAERFFDDLAQANSARFYGAVAALGRLFMEIEAEAFAMQSEALAPRARSHTA
jgi:TorA maturation chaperone TorD